MRTMSEDPPIPYLERLREELVASHPAVRRARAQRRVGALAVAAALVATIVVTVTVLGGAPASAAVTVTEDGESVVVRITSGRADVAEVVAALREADVDARVSPLTTGPSGVGRFVKLDSVRLGAAIRDRVGSGFAAVRFPAVGAGATVISVGSAAAPGARYEVLSDAYQPGEPLGCLALRGMSASEAASVLAARGVDVTWVDLADQTVEAPPAQGFVGKARATGADSVRIDVTATPEPAPLPRGCR